MSDEEKVEMNREDDKFLRKIIWFLIVAFLTSAGGWVRSTTIQQGQIDANTRALEEIKRLQRTMQDINVGVIKLVENSLVRNEIMREQKTQQDYIFGEQKRRKPIIGRVSRHMDNRSIHR